MATQRAHIVLPADLIKEIDAVVGPRGRSTFIAETARAELRRRWLLDYFTKGEPIWKDEDHPELANGVDAWRRTLWGGRERLARLHGEAWDALTGSKAEEDGGQ
jgi:hypothetical protein